MKKISIVLLLLVVGLLNAQTSIVKGIVYDENKVPLSGATISLINSDVGEITDENGYYELALNAGTYILVVKYIGYQVNKQQIQVANGTIINDVDLLPFTTVLDEILVSAVRANTNVPVTFSNISKKELAKRNLGQDIPILLNYLPSVISSSDAGAGVGYTYMNVRGSNGERINVTINGIPYNDAESHGTFWVNLGDFASSTENLQLQRGVGTSTNGSGAFGASLNILTDAIATESGAEISNSFGSFGTRKHTVKFTTGKLNNNIEIAGRLSNIYSDGYVDRAFSDLKSYFLQGSYSDENTLIKAITFGGKEKTYQAWYGLDATQLQQNRRQNPYTYDNEVDDYQQNHYQLHWNEQWNDQWSTNLGLNYTRGAGFFEQYKPEESAASFNNLIQDGSDVIVRRWLENDFYVVNFNANYKNETIDFITGLSYSSYLGDHFGEVIWANKLVSSTAIRDRYYESDATKKDFSIFAKATLSITDRLSGYADIQGRFVNYATSGLSSDRVPIAVDTAFDFFNPKVGLTYKINTSNQLYTSFAVANREPNRNDFESGVTSPETLHDLEFGWRHKSDQLLLNTNIYYMNYKNQLVLTGAIDDVGAPIRATSGKSYRFGLEVDAAIKLSEEVSVKPNAAFSINRNTDFVASIDGGLKDLGNTPISFSPSMIFGNIITYQPLEELQCSLLSKYVSDQWMSNLNSSVSKNDVLTSYFTSDFNASLSMSPSKIFKSVVLTLLVNNIFDAEYVDRGYYYTYDDTWSNANQTTTIDGAGYYPQATRNFLVGLTLGF